MELMTEKQKALIECMNEFANGLYEYFDLSYPRTKNEAREYITKNIELYKLASANTWVIENGYF